MAGARAALPSSRAPGRDGIESFLATAKLDCALGSGPLVRGALDYLEALDAELDQAGDPATDRARRYFAELDRQAHPDLLPAMVARGEVPHSVARTRRQQIGRVTDELRLRLEGRARSRMTRLSPSRSSATRPCSAKADLLELSELQLAIAGSFFGYGSRFDLAAFEEAHERFANGELRLWLPDGVWTTQPSSGFHFFFGEFALLALERRIHAGRWSVLANVLVRSQRIFARVYGATDAARATLGSFAPRNHAASRSFTSDEKRALRREFAGASHADLAQVANAHMQSYLPGLV